MRHVLTRQQLYEMVWQRAISKVAPELGISDVGLRKKCVAHAVPTPDAVYWGRRHAERPVTPRPLPPAPQGVSDQIIIFGRSSDDMHPEVKGAIAASRNQQRPVITQGTRDKLVRATLAAAKRAEPDRDWGAVAKLGSEYFRLRVHPSMLGRAADFLNLLVRFVKSDGYHFKEGVDGLDVVVDGEPIAFIVTQTIRRTRHVETDAEARRRERWLHLRHAARDWSTAPSMPEVPWWDFEPADVLSIEIGGWARFAGATHRYTDSASRKLEERIGDILASLAGYAAGIKAARVEADKRAQREAAALAERQRQAHLASLEAERVKYLEGKIRQFDDVRALSDLLGHLQPDDSTDQTAATFLTWARSRLQKLSSGVSAETIAAETGAIEAFSDCAEQQVGPGGD